MCKFDLTCCDSPDAVLHLQGIICGLDETIGELAEEEDEEQYGDELVPDGHAVL